jgi:hypothetical protein
MYSRRNTQNSVIPTAARSISEAEGDGKWRNLLLVSRHNNKARNACVPGRCLGLLRKTC